MKSKFSYTLAVVTVILCQGCSLVPGREHTLYVSSDFPIVAGVVDRAFLKGTLENTHCDNGEKFIVHTSDSQVTENKKTTTTYITKASCVPSN